MHPLDFRNSDVSDTDPGNCFCYGSLANRSIVRSRRMRSLFLTQSGQFSAAFQSNVYDGILHAFIVSFIRIRCMQTRVCVLQSHRATHASTPNISWCDTCKLLFIAAGTIFFRLTVQLNCDSLLHHFSCILCGRCLLLQPLSLSSSSLPAATQIYKRKPKLHRKCPEYRRSFYGVYCLRFTTQTILKIMKNYQAKFVSK